jgi:predicted amidohydrolase YtcJ
MTPKATLIKPVQPVTSTLLVDRPQLIIYNAHVITVNPNQPYAQALAILGDRILAVGSNDQVCGLASPGTQMIDIEGCTVVPGFIDAHCHVGYAGLLHLRCVNCDLRTIPAIQTAILDRVETTLPGEWIQGFQYDDTKTVERRFLTRQDLDMVAPHHPVFVQHRGGHTAFVNSLALERLGISELTDDPPGGRFDRDPQTFRLTGRVCESAMNPFLAAIPSEFTRTERQQAATLVTHMMSRAGITSAQDMWSTPEDLRSYQDAYADGVLPVRLYCLMYYPNLDKMLAAGLRTGFGDPWVRLGGLKLVCDGSISERTAYLSVPYVGRPNDYGILVMDEEELYAYAIKAHLADWQIGVHANGDAAIDIVLRLYERLQREHPRPDPRFRLEHCTILNKSLIRRIKALNAIPTPFSSYVYYRGEIMAEYGAERLETMFALRSLLDAGIMVAPGSDYPPGPFEPMMMLQSAVTRTDSTGHVWGASQRITVTEAIRIGTLHGAYASFEEQLKGSLEPGKLADLVVLGDNPETREPGTLIDIPIERTMVGGQWVFEA